MQRAYQEIGAISIHALREEGDSHASKARKAQSISIHALREEGDAQSEIPKAQNCEFLSTPSARRATCGPYGMQRIWRNFYPRPPRGGRPPAPPVQAGRLRYFYPRPPRGGRPDFGLNLEIRVDISIHALREEGDQRWPAWRTPCSNFYPRPPRGGRPISSISRTTMHEISIHALREEGDDPKQHRQRQTV